MNKWKESMRDKSSSELRLISKSLEDSPTVNHKDDKIEFIKSILEDRELTEQALKYLKKQQSAKESGKEFTLTLADWARLMNRKKCFYTGVVLTDTGPTKRTIDRIDNNEGYTRGNSVACSLIANQIKNTLFEHENDPLFIPFDHMKKLIDKMSKVL